MFFDDRRNRYYLDAIREAVDRGSIVLDIGAGLGLHGIMAAREGARKVYLVEPEPILDITRQLVGANSLSGHVKCLSGKIEELNLPEKVDLIISVFTGNFLLEEDLLPSLFYARDKYLKPGGELIPDRATMEVVPVCMPEYYAKHIDRWAGSAHGVSVNLVRNFAANSLYYDEPENWKAEFLSSAVELLELDFMTAKEASCRAKTQVKITRDGLCHGWLGWFRMRLGNKWLSTSPTEKQMHWRQVFLPLAEPVSVKEGDTLSFELNRPEFGEWTWATGFANECRRHSTFFSQPVSPAALKKKSDGYKARLSSKGQAARDVFLGLDSEQSTEEIVNRLMASYPKLFPSRRLVDQFVKNIVWKYSE